MTYAAAPVSVRSLEQRIRNLEDGDQQVQRRRITMSLVVIGQMLPEGAVKGGGALALRLGQNSRFTRDLDAARTGTLAAFRRAFEENLSAGWAGFTGRLVSKTAAKPPSVPTAYVMQPFEVKLSYHGRSWCTVPFELGQNELGDAEGAERFIADDLKALFAGVGLHSPAPIPVMRTEHQIAQKLHAVSEHNSKRARDLVDIQLLERNEALDLPAIATACIRLFSYRRQHSWPPQIHVGAGWATLYEEASAGLAVAPSVDEAVDQVNDLVKRICAAVP